jgi:hypothetical protein
MQAHEVQTWLCGDYSKLVFRLYGTMNRQVDPGEAGVEARAPDHVGDIQNQSVFQQRLTVTNSRHSRNSFDPGGLQVLWFDPNERSTRSQHLCASLAADWRSYAQDSVKYDSEDDRHEESADETVQAEGHVTGVPSGHPGSVTRSNLHRYLST